MRTQTIAALFDGQEWVAESVDPTGWLADPTTEIDPTGGSVVGLSAGQQDATSTRDVAGGRADGGRDGKNSGRSARRTGRVRHLRRVRTENLQTAVVSEEAPEPQGAEGYQMGRWARLALTVTVLAAIVVVVVSLTAGSAPPVMVDVTVAPGDTLWSIAAQAAPDRDPRDVIDEIRQLNDMQGGVLPIGVVLRVPAAAR